MVRNKHLWGMIHLTEDEHLRQLGQIVCLQHLVFSIMRAYSRDLKLDKTNPMFHAFLELKNIEEKNNSSQTLNCSEIS